MIVHIDVEDEGWARVPALEQLTESVLQAAAKSTQVKNAEVAVLFTSDEEIARLNAEWRGKAKPTNVLSFPADDFPVPDGEARPIGDIVLAAGVVAAEAEDQGKSMADHAAHLMVHGFLHLLGNDHETEAEAEKMEDLERHILKGLGISDPYERQ